MTVIRASGHIACGQSARIPMFAGTPGVLPALEIRLERIPS